MAKDQDEKKDQSEKEELDEQGGEGEEGTETVTATDTEAGTEADEAGTDAEAGAEADEVTDAEAGGEASDVEVGVDALETDAEGVTEAEGTTDAEAPTEVEESTDADVTEAEDATEGPTDTEAVSETEDASDTEEATDGEGETWQETMDEGDTAEEEKAKSPPVHSGAVSEGDASDLDTAETETLVVPSDAEDMEENKVDTMVDDILGGQTSEGSATSDQADVGRTATIQPELGFSPLDRRLSEILRSLPEYRVFYQPSQMSVASAGSLVSVPSEPLAMGHYPSGDMPRLAGGPQLLMPGMLPEDVDEESAEVAAKKKEREDMDRSWEQIQVDWSHAKTNFLDELEAYGEMVHHALKIVETHRNKENDA